MSQAAPVTVASATRCRDSATTPAGPAIGPMGSVRSAGRGVFRSSPRSVADGGVSTKPAATRLTRIGTTSCRQTLLRAYWRGPGPQARPAVPGFSVPMPGVLQARRAGLERNPGPADLQEAPKEADMSSSEVRSPGRDTAAGTVDMRLEVDIIPVSDVDRSKQFYQRLGWRLDADV